MISVSVDDLVAAHDVRVAELDEPPPFEPQRRVVRFGASGRGRLATHEHWRSSLQTSYVSYRLERLRWAIVA